MTSLKSKLFTGASSVFSAASIQVVKASSSGRAFQVKAYHKTAFCAQGGSVISCQSLLHCEPCNTVVTSKTHVTISIVCVDR